MGPSEESLLSKATGGDQDALSVLLKRHGPRVARELSISDQYHAVLDTDDVMQVTFVEVFLNIDRFCTQGGGSFPAWLRTIAQNNLRDAIRALESEKRPPPSRRLEPAGEDSSLALLSDLAGVTFSTPSRRASREELKSLLEAAIKDLPADYARAVRLFDLEGCTGPEVATAMQRSAGAVHMLRARARDRLREQLGSSSRFFSNGA